MNKNSINPEMSSFIDYCFDELSDEDAEDIEDKICNDTYLYNIVLGIFKVKDELRTKEKVIKYFIHSKQKGIQQLEQFIAEKKKCKEMGIDKLLDNLSTSE